MARKHPMPNLLLGPLLSTTEHSRLAHPARYQRKDARTQALRLTYGQQKGDKPPGEITLPPRIEDLRLSDEASYLELRQKLISALGRAGWPTSTGLALLKDFQKFRKPGKSAAQSLSDEPGKEA